MVTILRGIPGSGKSFFAHRKYYNGALVIEADQRFIAPDGEYKFDGSRHDSTSYISDVLRAALKHNALHVIITTASPNAGTIVVWRSIAYEYGHDVKVICMDCDHPHTEHKVPEARIQEMKDHWQLIPGETYIIRHTDKFIAGSEYEEVDYPPKWYRGNKRTEKNG